MPPSTHGPRWPPRPGIIATLVYTAARVGAVAKLKLKHVRQTGNSWSFRFAEKGGKSRELPIRSDLEIEILAYLTAASLSECPKDSPLFRSAVRRTGKLTDRAMSAIDICRMIKRRLHAAKLPGHLSPHSFRVATLTDLLESGVELATSSTSPVMPIRGRRGYMIVEDGGSFGTWWSGSSI